MMYNRVCCRCPGIWLLSCGDKAIAVVLCTQTCYVVHMCKQAVCILCAQDGMLCSVCVLLLKACGDKAK